MRKRTVNDALLRAQAEGQGVLQIEVIQGCDVLALTLSRSHAAQQRLRWIAGTLAWVVAADPPAICLLCNYEFARDRMPAAFALLLAAIDAPTVSITNALCPHCAAQGDIALRVARHYQRIAVSSELRILPGPLAPGRA